MKVSLFLATTLACAYGSSVPGEETAVGGLLKFADVCKANANGNSTLMEERIITASSECSTYLKTTQEYKCIEAFSAMIPSDTVYSEDTSNLVEDAMGTVNEDFPLTEEELVEFMNERGIDALAKGLFPILQDPIVSGMATHLDCLGADKDALEMINMISNLKSEAELAALLRVLFENLKTQLQSGETTSRRLLADSVGQVKSFVRQLQGVSSSRPTTCGGETVQSEGRYLAADLAQWDAFSAVDPQVCPCDDTDFAKSIPEGHILIDDKLMKKFNDIIANDGGNIKELSQKVVNLFTTLFREMVDFSAEKGKQDDLCKLPEGGISFGEGDKPTEEEIKLGKQCIQQAMNPEGLLMASLYNGDKLPSQCSNLNNALCGAPILPLLDTPPYSDGTLATFFGHDWVGGVEPMLSVQEQMISVCEAKLESSASMTALSVSSMVATVVAALYM